MSQTKVQTHQTARWLTVAVVLCSLASGAQAHTGHGTHSLFEGLVHPFGLDHLLAMVAVGVWSVSALPSSQVGWGPATFMLALLAGAALGVAGVQVPALETLVALSVVLFGLMLALSRQQLPIPAGVVLVALAGALHGLAHGAEAPGSGFAAYAVGFVVTTAGLHLAGVLAALGIRQGLTAHAHWVIRCLGAVLGVTGMVLVTQV
jgi:urease accessory protein